jgi:hypothetical protein
MTSFACSLFERLLIGLVESPENPDLEEFIDGLQASFMGLGPGSRLQVVAEELHSPPAGQLRATASQGGDVIES